MLCKSHGTYNYGIRIHGNAVHISFEPDTPMDLEVYVFGISPDGDVEYCIMSIDKTEFKMRLTVVEAVLWVTDNAAEDMSIAYADFLNRQLEVTAAAGRRFLLEMEL